MKRMFTAIYEVLEEIGRARATQRLGRSGWYY